LPTGLLEIDVTPNAAGGSAHGSEGFLVKFRPGGKRIGAISLVGKASALRDRPLG
jgi:hypothetical protein